MGRTRGHYATASSTKEIQTQDLYKDIAPHVQDKFDTSNYPADNSSGIPTGVNKKIIGKFKDECEGKRMKEFIGLRAKMYLYQIDHGKETKKKPKV